jgi:PKD repeat protein
MKKHLIVYGVVIIILIVGFNGCIESEKDNEGNNQYVDELPEDDNNIENNENDNINNSILINETYIESIKVKIISGEKLGSNSLSYSFKGIILDNNSNYMDYFWDFGDNSTSEVKNIDHIYKKSGKYLVMLTVFDDIGNIGIAEKELNVFPIVCYTCNL